MKKRYLLLLICLTLASAWTEENKPLPLGFIFNISNVFDAPESYQGGIGIKFITEKVNMRLLGDYYYSQESSTSSLAIGIALEKHLNNSFISPYFGFSMGASYIMLEDRINDDNWTTETIVPIEGGPIFGIEVFVTEYLSFFTEYIINVSYRMDATTQSVGGTETTTDDSYLTVDTKMGNNAKLGLTIYLDSHVTMPERKR